MTSANDTTHSPVSNIIKRAFLLCNQFYLINCVSEFVLLLILIIATIIFFRSNIHASSAITRREPEKRNYINLFFDTFWSTIKKAWNEIAFSNFILNQKSNEARTKK